MIVVDTYGDDDIENDFSQIWSYCYNFPRVQESSSETTWSRLSKETTAKEGTFSSGAPCKKIYMTDTDDYVNGNDDETFSSGAPCFEGTQECWWQLLISYCIEDDGDDDDDDETFSSCSPCFEGTQECRWQLLISYCFDDDGDNDDDDDDAGDDEDDD